MEHESFEDAEVAKLMNENFICIKVDREERPDVDQVYMTCLLYTSPSPRDRTRSRMPSSA